MKSKFVSKWRFMSYWLIGHAIVAMIASIMWLTVLPATRTIGLVLEGGVWVALISLQYLIVPQQWRPAIKHWIGGSLIAWLIGAVTIQSLAFDIGVSERLLLYPIYFLPIGIIQAWTLRSRFNKAWIWVVALLLSAITQALLENAVLNDVWLTNILAFPIKPLTIAIHTIIPTAQAIITGWMLIYMSYSIKRDENMRLDEKSQDYRLERLEEKHSTLEDVVSGDFVTQSDTTSSG